MPCGGSAQVQVQVQGQGHLDPPVLKHQLGLQLPDDHLVRVERLRQGLIILPGVQVQDNQDHQDQQDHQTTRPTSPHQVHQPPLAPPAPTSPTRPIRPH